MKINLTRKLSRKYIRTTHKLKALYQELNEFNEDYKSILKEWRIALYNLDSIPSDDFASESVIIDTIHDELKERIEKDTEIVDLIHRYMNSITNYITEVYGSFDTFYASKSIFLKKKFNCRKSYVNNSYLTNRIILPTFKNPIYFY